MRLTLGRLDSPIGQVLTATDADGRLRALDFHDYEDRLRRLLIRHYGEVELVEGETPEPVRAALEAWFAGDLRAFDGLTVVTGGTDFQRRVWAALREIPAGETRSYGQLAAAIGQPTAVRAVGLANGANPVGIVTPCHRVIGAGGALTGYAGGVERKRWLLEHERAARTRP
ncbi:methylated-DNA--[protein]-cysteine S-methyltransferase [Brevundimonas sp. PAMC22021]|nr:methylated-DNA--[protein]-cysteine S-methyltransferase [Brevundimonas sp. PAMC22021]